MYLSMVLHGKETLSISSKSNKIIRCSALYPTPTPEVKNGFVLNTFNQSIQRSKADVCVLAEANAIDCGTNSFGFREFNTNPNANKCAVSSFRNSQPFVYHETWSGIDDFHESWVVGAANGKIYFIDNGYYLSLGQSVSSLTFLCTEPVVERMYKSEVEIIRCKAGTKLKETVFSPFAPS